MNDLEELDSPFDVAAEEEEKHLNETTKISADSAQSPTQPFLTRMLSGRKFSKLSLSSPSSSSSSSKSGSQLSQHSSQTQHMKSFTQADMLWAIETAREESMSELSPMAIVTQCAQRKLEQERKESDVCLSESSPVETVSPLGYTEQDIKTTSGDDLSVVAPVDSMSQSALELDHASESKRIEEKERAQNESKNSEMDEKTQAEEQALFQAAIKPYLMVMTSALILIDRIDHKNGSTPWKDHKTPAHGLVARYNSARLDGMKDQFAAAVSKVRATLQGSLQQPEQVLKTSFTNQPRDQFLDLKSCLSTLASTGSEGQRLLTTLKYFCWTADMHFEQLDNNKFF